MMKTEILSHLTAECPWRDTLYWYDTIDSTNTRGKQLAQEGAAHGTVLIAANQTGGRGRMGRQFSSPAGMGVYLSVILRPCCAPDALMHLTCAAAVAACRAVEAACGLSPAIKWTNDLVCGRKKLGGILTELALDSKTGLVDYAVIGIGINCLQNSSDFPPEVREIAASIRQLTGTDCSPAKLAAALIQSLYQTDSQLLTEKAQLMEQYRRRCMTLGQQISIVRGDQIQHATAFGLDEDGGLIVRYADGRTETVSSGEVSVRGMYGYV